MYPYDHDITKVRDLENDPSQYHPLSGDLISDIIRQRALNSKQGLNDKISSRWKKVGQTSRNACTLDFEAFGMYELLVIPTIPFLRLEYGLVV